MKLTIELCSNDDPRETLSFIGYCREAIVELMNPDQFTTHGRDNIAILIETLELLNKEALKHL